MADALEAPPPAPLGQGLAAAHVVVIVDHSGSMRKGDVPGYDSRTAAVYDCLAKDLVEPQLKNGGGEGMQVGASEPQGVRSYRYRMRRIDPLQSPSDHARPL